MVLASLTWYPRNSMYCPHPWRTTTSSTQLLVTMFPTLSSVQRLTANNKLFEEAAEEVALTGLSRSGSEASSAAPSFERPEPLENGDFWAGFQDDILPEKENDKKVRFLRHQVFTLYRKLFSAAIFINLIIFIWLLVRGTNALEVAGVTIANLFVSILHRQDYVINAYFWLFTRVPLSWVFYWFSIRFDLYASSAFHSGFVRLLLASTTLEVSTLVVEFRAQSGLFYIPAKPPKSLPITEEWVHDDA